MSETLKTEEKIREYLLGRIGDEGELAQYEELLFTDEEFCSMAEIVEDSIVNDYVFNRLDDADARDFEKSLVNTSDRPIKRGHLSRVEGVRDNAWLRGAPAVYYSWRATLALTCSTCCVRRIG